MRKVRLIFKREYLQEVRTKWFIVFAVLPFIGAGILGGIVALKNRGAFSDLFKKERIAVIDDSKVLMDRLAENKSYEFVPADETQDLNEEVLEGSFAGYLIIDKDVLANGKMTYYTKSVGDIDEIRKIERNLNAAIFEERLSKSTIDPEELMRIRSYISFKYMKVTPTGEKEEKGLSFALAFAMLIVLYISIIWSGSMVGRSVTEEKTNKVIEIIITAIKPFQLMFGKLLAKGGVAFTLLFIYGIVGVVFIVYGEKFTIIPNIPAFSIPAGVAAYFAIAFVLGYLLFASLVMTFVSTAGSERDAHQAQGLPIILILIPFYIAIFYVIRQPDTVASVFLSLFPLFTPLLMPVRLAVSTPPMWQIYLSILLLIAAVFFMIWVSAKIYRVGILMYGKRLKLSEIIRWLRYS
jgi:ABC-2 type transport system permease protein